jgi:hypothetical protein
MEKIFVHGKGLVDKSSANNEKFNLFGQLPGDANKTLIANVKTMSELKIAKAEWNDVFEKEGIVLTVGTNKEVATVGK